MPNPEKRDLSGAPSCRRVRRDAELREYLPVRRCMLGVRLALAERRSRGRTARAVDGQPGGALIHIDVTPADAGIAKRIRRVDFRLRASDSIAKIGQQSVLARAGRDQVERVNRPALADAIHPADALFETHGIPRQFQIDDDPAGALEIEPFAGRISGQENRALAFREYPERCCPVLTRETTMQEDGGPFEVVCDVHQRVAILRENDGRFAEPNQKTGKG